MKQSLLLTTLITASLPLHLRAEEPLPFYTDFSQPETAEKFTIIDLNPQADDPFPYTWVIGTKTVDLNGPDPEGEMVSLDATDPQWRDGIDTDLRLAAVYNGYRRSDPTHKPGREGNDFLITPPFRAIKGATYTLTIQARTNSMTDSGNRMAIHVAQHPTSDAMLSTQPIGTITKFKNASGAMSQPGSDIYTFTVVPDFDGDFYIGFHAISDPDKIFWINNISLTMESGTGAPLPVEALTVIPGERGELTASLEFDLPTKDTEGNDLSKIDRVAVYLDGDPVPRMQYTDEAVPGKHFSINDTLKEGSDGFHTYKVTVSANGANSDQETTVWIGEDLAGPVGDLALTATDDSYELSWEKPTAALHDGYIDFDGLKYICLASVRFSSGDPVQTQLGTFTDTHASIPKSVFNGFPGQYFITFYLFPQSAAGTDFRNSRSTVNTVGGELFRLPYRESFAGGALATEPWTVNDVPEYGLEYAPAWGFSEADTGRFGLDSQDDDRGYAIFHNTAYAFFPQRLVSPMIDCGDAANPMLIFYTGHAGELSGDTSVTVELFDGNSYTPLDTDIALDQTGWTRHEVSLKNDADMRSFRISFKVAGAYDDILLLDNILVEDASGNSVTVPSADDSISIAVRKGGLELSGECLFHIYTLSGVSVAAGQCRGSEYVSLEPGTYIFKTGSRFKKFIVE